MADFCFSWEKEPEPPKQATVITFKEPEPDEYEQAMDEFYNEIYKGFWRSNK